ncbi:MAG: aminotransferase class I/II-fold pyridoxal phosphate-dependent enzyme [Clostridia bacterium]|nr:aminotransferase class I/II-fold pyridoxal phosphate-dependent enzyme [Clostridia bacterium]
MNYEKLLSDKVKSIEPSGIRKFFDIVAEMSDAISLGVGEPDFVTPWHIRNRGIQSLEHGHTHYTSNAGLLELRKEVVKYLERRVNLSYTPENVIITVGGSEAIDLCIRSLVDPGDEVLIPDPSFVCYKPCTVLAGGVPVPIVTKAENRFKLTAEQLKAAITPKTKLLILPYPNNPTGAIMTEEDLEEIAEVLRGTDILVLSDEIYLELTYGRKHVSIANISGMKERTVIVNGFSKSYAMTGWRLGFAVGPAEIMSAMLKIHQYAIMSSPTTSQYAAVDALRNGDDDIERMRNEYDCRRRIIVDGFNSMGLSCFEPEGAFYVFPSIQSTGLTSEEFCVKLLEKEKVAVVPGTAFGTSGEGFVRCSYAYSIKNIYKALERIKHFVETRGWEAGE